MTFPSPGSHFAPQPVGQQILYNPASGGGAPTYLPSPYQSGAYQIPSQHQVHMARPMLTPVPQPPPPAAPPTPVSIPTLPTTSSVVQTTPQKKIARVQPQPSNKLVRPLATKAKTVQQQQQPPRPSTSSSRVDPIKALSSMANQPMSASMSITHQSRQEQGGGASSSIKRTDSSDIDVGGRKPGGGVHVQRSVGTQAKIGAPLKILTPRPWKGSSDSPASSSTTPTPTTPTPTTFSAISVPLPMTSSDCESGAGGSSSVLLSRPSSTLQQLETEVSSSSRCSTPKSMMEHSYAASSSSPSTTQTEDEAVSTEDHFGHSISVKTKKSKTNSIKFVLQRDATNEAFKVQEVSVKDGSKKTSAMTIEPEAAIRALKIKAKVSRRARLKKADFVAKLDGNGCVPLTEDDFINEQESNRDDDYEDEQAAFARSSKSKPLEDEHIVYELTSDDGFRAESTDATAVWRQVFEAVQEARLHHSLAPLPLNPLGEVGLQMLGLTHSALAYLLEQMPGAREMARQQQQQQRAMLPKGDDDDSDDEDEDQPLAPAPIRDNDSGSAR
jgi:hypothetical protein